MEDLREIPYQEWMKSNARPVMPLNHRTVRTNINFRKRVNNYCQHNHCIYKFHYRMFSDWLVIHESLLGGPTAVSKTMLTSASNTKQTNLISDFLNGLSCYGFESPLFYLIKKII